MTRIVDRCMAAIAIAFTLAQTACNKNNMDQNQQQGKLSTAAYDLKYNATNVPLSAATKTALLILQGKNPNTTVSIKSAETVTKNGVPYMHIINSNSNNGWVILSADSMYAPLLAFDKSGNFDKGNINPGLGMWLNKHAHELKFIRSTKSAYTDSISTVNKMLWTALGSNLESRLDNAAMQSPPVHTQGTPPPQDGSGVRQVITTTSKYWSTSVGPLCITQWSQGWPFNMYTPLGSYQNGHTAAGCVPIAMAQIMYYWQYANVAYNWSGMPLKNNLGLTTDYQGLAQMISEIGIRSRTTYGNGDDESSTNNEICPQVFNSYGYSSAQRSQGYFSQGLSGPNNGTSFSSFLTAEAQANRPQTYINLLHMNWGWGTNLSFGGPNNDSWYNANVDYTASPNAKDYQYFQTIIYNIHP